MSGLMTEERSLRVIQCFVPDSRPWIVQIAGKNWNALLGFLNLSPATILRQRGKCHNVIKHRALGGFEEKNSNLSTVEKKQKDTLLKRGKKFSPYHLVHEHKRCLRFVRFCVLLKGGQFSKGTIVGGMHICYNCFITIGSDTVLSSHLLY